PGGLPPRCSLTSLAAMRYAHASRSQYLLQCFILRARSPHYSTGKRWTLSQRNLVGRDRHRANHRHRHFLARPHFTGEDRREEKAILRLRRSSAYVCSRFALADCSGPWRGFGLTRSQCCTSSLMAPTWTKPSAITARRKRRKARSEQLRARVAELELQGSSKGGQS